MSDAGFSLQKAIYTALNGNVGAGVAVYNHVPQNAAYPYVVIDGCESVPSDYFTERKSDYYVYLSIWSQYRGNKQVLDIISAIDTQLHRKKLPLDAGSMIDCEIKRKRVNIDADAITYMGSVSLFIQIGH